MKKTDPGTEAKEKIKSKLFVLNESSEHGKTDASDSKKIKIPKNLIVTAKDSTENKNFKVRDRKGETGKLSKKQRDEKHYHLHLYHHLWTKNSKANETEPSKQGSKVSGIGGRAQAHTESREEDTTAEVGAVTGVNELKRHVKNNQYFKDSAKELPKHRRKQQAKNCKLIKLEDSKGSQDSQEGEDLYDEQVLETIVSLGYPIEEVIRLIEEEDEKMINLYLKLLEENHSHLKAIYPSYMRSK